MSWPGTHRRIEVAARLADWVCWRTGRLSYAHMQRILVVEYGGIAEALANLYRLTGERPVPGRPRSALTMPACSARWRAGQDRLSGVHANMTVPKIIASVRHVGGNRPPPLP